MKRRDFLINTPAIASVPVLASMESFPKAALESKNKPMVTSYYFRAHTYTMVPKQIREDLAWMKKVGTKNVAIAVLEQDLYAAVENIELIIKEANKLGLKAFLVPSRWGGIIAGAPKVPSLFSVINPDTWVLNKDLKPRFNSITGVTSSIYDPKTLEFFCETLRKSLTLWNFEGVILDEPKVYDTVDYHPRSLELHGDKPKWENHIDEVSKFFSKVFTFQKTNFPKVSSHLFVYANSHPVIRASAAQIENLDFYGCDGRPWNSGEGVHNEQAGKNLVDKAPAFIEEAKKNKKKSLILIENHNMVAEDYPLMQKRLPEVKALKTDHVIYYYYPRNVQEPERQMKIIGDFISSL